MKNLLYLSIVFCALLGTSEVFAQGTICSPLAVFQPNPSTQVKHVTAGWIAPKNTYDYDALGSGPTHDTRLGHYSQVLVENYCEAVIEVQLMAKWYRVTPTATGLYKNLIKHSVIWNGTVGSPQTKLVHNVASYTLIPWDSDANVLGIELVMYLRWRFDGESEWNELGEAVVPRFFYNEEHEEY